MCVHAVFVKVGGSQLAYPTHHLCRPRGWLHRYNGGVRDVARLAATAAKAAPFVWGGKKKKGKGEREKKKKFDDAGSGAAILAPQITIIGVENAIFCVCTCCVRESGWFATGLPTTSAARADGTDVTYAGPRNT